MRSALNKISLFILQNIPAVVLLFIPLFFLTNTIDYFAFNKFYLLNFLASLALISWCVQNIVNGRISIVLSPSLTALFVLVLVHLASAFFMSPTKVLSLTGLTTLFASLFIIHFTFTSTNPNIKIIKRHIFTLLLSLLVTSIITILHYFNLSSYILGSELTASPYFNLSGGIFPALTFTIPLLFATLIYIYFETDLKTKIALFIFSSVIITATIINISLMLPKNGVSPISRLPLSASWSIAIDILKYPGTALIGTGPENYLATFTRLRPNSLNSNTQLWNTRFNESGSFLLTLFTTAGLIGGISFFLLFFKNILQSLKNFGSAENKSVLAFLTASITGFLIVFIFTPAGIISLIVASILLGILTQVLKKENVSKIKTLHFNISSDESPNKVLSNFLPIFTLIISLAIIITYWTFGGRFYLASVYLRQANQKINTDLAGSFLKQQEAQKLNPYDSSFSIILSQTYQQVSLFYLQKENPTELDKKNAIESMQRTIDFGRQAARLDPFNVLVWENLSNIYQTFIGAADGSSDLAISHLAQAIALDPTNPRLRLQLGILFYNLKDIEQSLKLIGQSIDLKPNWEVPYANLYSIYLQAQEYSRAEANLKQALSLMNPQQEEYTKLQTELQKLTEKINSLPQATPSAQVQK